MIYSISFSREVEKVLKKWKKSNPQNFEKAAKIIGELAIHPRTGLGHPEPLRGGQDITWSRHITAHDRIIYDIHDTTVHVDVLEIEGHYKDK